MSEQLLTEDAVMSSEIEQLPDLRGFLKIASQPQWRRSDHDQDVGSQRSSAGYFMFD